MSAELPLTLAVDIGKTTLKLSLLDAAGELLEERREVNTPLDSPPYLHLDADGIWHWVLSQIATLPQRERIGAVMPVAHGAAVALIDRHGLVLPVMDYEFTGVGEYDADYAALRDDYALTLSPALPGGLNIARQLYWLQRRCPAEFARAEAALTYAQYWSWRLSGVAALEITSLGCHSDLWAPVARDYAPLVHRLGWERLLPPIRAAWAALGPPRPEVIAATGLPEGCRVLCGIHDNNASMIQHLYGAPRAPCVNVVSSGTWVIVAGIGAELAVLDPARDMQANVDAWGRPFPCARFMGGREFARLNARAAAGCDWEDLAALVAAGTLALPTFAEMGGPYGHRRGEIRGPAPATPQAEYALATLYAALVTDDCLGRLQDRGDIVVEGPYATNPHYAALLGALRPAQRVWVSEDRAGTSGGAYLLARQPARVTAHRHAVPARDLPGLAAYRAAWREALRHD